MATIGNTSTPTQVVAWYVSGQSNMLAIRVTMPQAGTITAVTCYMAGHGSTIHPRMCVWNNSGTLVASSGGLTVSAGTGGRSGQGFQTGTLSSSYAASNGETLYIGYWRPSNESDEWSEQTGGTEYQTTNSSNSTPGNLNTSNSTSGTPSFYATYTPAPSISGLNTNQGYPGSSLTISGSYFGSSQGGSSVKFGTTPATVTSWGDGSITVTVPSINPSLYSVTVTRDGITSSGQNFTVLGGGVRVATSLTTFARYWHKIWGGSEWGKHPLKTWNGTDWVRRG